MISKKDLIMRFWLIFGNFWCPVVTLVMISSNLHNFERNPKKPQKLEMNEKIAKKFKNLKMQKKVQKIKQKKIKKIKEKLKTSLKKSKNGPKIRQSQKII